MTYRAPRKVQGWIIGISLALLVLPLLFFSSPEIIGATRVAALALILVLTKQAFPCGIGPSLKIALMALLLLLASSWTGARLNHYDMMKETLLEVMSLVSIAGMSVLIATILSRPLWWRFMARCLIAIPAVLLVVSLTGYFLPLEKLIPMGNSRHFFDAQRLALIWPSRFTMTWAGQVGWEHANHAGLLFGVALIFLLDFLASGKAIRRRLWWIAGTLLGVAIFLTASRNAMIMVVAGLPWILIGRPWSWGWLLRLAALCAASLALGVLALKAKEALLKPPPNPVENIPVTPPPAKLPASPSPRVEVLPTPPDTRPAPPRQPDGEPLPPAVPPPAPPAVVEPAKDVHLKGLFERGTGGRFHSYHVFWMRFQESLVFGRGLTENLKPMHRLNHEHSSYLATFRGGGSIALAAHLMIIALSLLAAIRLFFRDKIRWPLLMFSTVITAILFDRGSVFVMNGSYEFLFHWVAVLCPLLTTIRAASLPADAGR